MSVHWDCGSVDTDSPNTPADNIEQFLELVKTLGASCPDIILCHCGAGPGMTDAEVDYWKSNLMDVIFGDSTYDHVYFDLAGMQIVGVGKSVRNLIDWFGVDLTSTGSAIRDYIQNYPDRFLFGTDSDNGEVEETQLVDADGNPVLDEAGSAEWRFGLVDSLGSIADYETFMSFPDSSGAALAESDKELVRWDNALFLGITP